jgi:hypothetical protein
LIGGRDLERRSAIVGDAIGEKGGDIRGEREIERKCGGVRRGSRGRGGVVVVVSRSVEEECSSNGRGREARGKGKDDGKEEEGKEEEDGSGEDKRCGLAVLNIYHRLSLAHHYTRASVVMFFLNFFYQNLKHQKTLCLFFEFVECNFLCRYISI